MMFDPFRDWLFEFGMAGSAAWIVLKILAIVVPVILAVVPRSGAPGTGSARHRPSPGVSRTSSQRTSRSTVSSR